MDTVTSTNLLFYVLSIFIICLTVGTAIFLIYFIKILKSILLFFNTIKDEADKIAKDVENIRGKVSSGGAMFASFVVNMLSFLKDHQKTEKKSKK